MLQVNSDFTRNQFYVKNTWFHEILHFFTVQDPAPKPIVHQPPASKHESEESDDEASNEVKLKYHEIFDFT